MYSHDGVYTHEIGFKESLKMCLDLERQWLYIQGLLVQDLDSARAIHLLSGILKLMEKLARSDIKLKLIKELTSFHEKLRIIEEQSLDDGTATTTIKIRFDEISKKLAMGARILSSHLITDPFLSKCYHRQIDIFDSPQCNTWRLQPPEEIKLQCQYWLHKLETTWQAIEAILWCVRSSAPFHSVTVSSGFYRDKEMQDVLGLSMVRVRHSNKVMHPVAVISHRWLAITFYQGSWVDGAYQHIQVEQDITIELSLCS